LRISGLSSATRIVLAMLPLRRGQSDLGLYLLSSTAGSSSPYRERSKRDNKVYRVDVGCTS
jgi:hypothetical protein